MALSINDTRHFAVSVFLAEDIANGGTLVLDYPSGVTQDECLPDGTHYAETTLFYRLNATDDFTVSFGASNITVTNAFGKTWPAGMKMDFGFDLRGFNQDILGVGDGGTGSRTAAGAAAALGFDLRFDSRAAATSVLANTGTETYIYVEKRLFIYDPTGTALTTGDGRTWSPAGLATYGHWGINGTAVSSSGYLPTPTEDEATAIQAAHDWCVVRGRSLCGDEDRAYGVASQIVWGARSGVAPIGRPTLRDVNIVWIGSGDTATTKDPDDLDAATYNGAVLTVGKVSGQSGKYPVGVDRVRVDGRRLKNPIAFVGASDRKDHIVTAERGVDYEVRVGERTGGTACTEAFITVSARHFAYGENGDGTFGSNDEITNVFDPSTAVDTGTSTITDVAHGMTEGYVVEYYHGGGSVIGGLTNYTNYYLVNVTDDTYQLSETPGGSAINLTSVGSGSTHQVKQYGTGHWGRNGRTSYGVILDSSDCQITGSSERGLQAAVLGTGYNMGFVDAYVWNGPDRGIGVTAMTVTKGAGTPVQKGRYWVRGGKIEDGAIRVGSDHGTIEGVSLAQYNHKQVQFFTDEADATWPRLIFTNNRTGEDDAPVLLTGIGSGTFKGFKGVFHGNMQSNGSPMTLQGREIILGQYTDPGVTVYDSFTNFVYDTQTNGRTYPDGHVIRVGSLLWIAESGATAISALPGFVPLGTPTPNHFAENTTQGTTDMAAAIQAAIDYAVSVAGAASGYFNKPAPVVNFRAEKYYVSGTITAESDARDLMLVPNGCLIVTDYDGVLFSFGDTNVFTADAAGTTSTYGIDVQGFKFKNTNLTATSSVAIRLGRCWNAVISENTFYDFWLDIDSHGTGHSHIENNFGFMRDRTASKQAFFRQQGVYASDKDRIDGTGIHFNGNEISGDPNDATAQSHFIEIKCCDGFYFAGNHAQHIDSFLTIEPAGSTDNYKNNRTFDIISGGNNYADNPGGNQVRLIGTVAYTGLGGRQNGLYKNIKLHPSDWIRGAGTATTGVAVSVADGGGYATQYDGLTGIELGAHYDQHDVPISVLGDNSSRLECIGLRISGARVSRARYGSSGGSGFGYIEAKSVVVTGCVVEAETNAPDQLFTFILSGADAGEGTAVTMIGNDFSESTYVQMYNLTTTVEASVNIYGNATPVGAGRIIKDTFRILGNQGEAALPWSYTIPSTETGVDVTVRALGQSHPSTGLQDRTTGALYSATFYKNAISATSVIGTTEQYAHSNVSSNAAPVRAILMTGSAWPTSTAVTAGDVYVSGGNVFLIVTSGTTGASAPVHTSGFASTGTETSVFIGAEDTDKIQIVLSGSTSTKMYWVGEVEMFQAR